VLACEIEPVRHSQSQAKATGMGLNGEGVKDCRKMGRKMIKEGGDRPLQSRGKMEQTGQEHEPGKKLD
jgi:hypothetical protein